MRHTASGYHVSRWPPWWTRTRRRDPAALLRAGDAWLLVDANAVAYPVTSHAEVIQTAADHNLDVYVGRLTSYPWLDQALVHLGHGTDAYADARRSCSGLSCRCGRKKIRIASSRAWGDEWPEPTIAFIRLLTDLYNLLGVGAYCTPAALGHAKMIAVYKSCSHPGQSRPSIALREALLEHRIGARADPPISLETYPECWEVDLHDAYAWAASLPLPVGPVTRLLPGDDYASYVHWFAECYVYIPYDLAHSPVLVKDDDGNNVPLMARGQHTVWLRKAEADELMALGATIIPRQGWGWEHLAPVLAEWSETMHRTRETTAGQLGSLVKRCIVAGLGRHGIKPVSWRIVPVASAPDGSRLLDARPDGPDLAVVEVPDDDSWALHHWYDYILMSIRLWQYRLVQAERRAGNTVIATDTDAVYLCLPPKTIIPDPTALGGHKVTRRINRRFPYPRAWAEPGRAHLPGVPRRDREELEPMRIVLLRKRLAKLSGRMGIRASEERVRIEEQLIAAEQASEGG